MCWRPDGVSDGQRWRLVRGVDEEKIGSFAAIKQE